MTLNLGKWRELWSALPEHGWPVSAAMRFLKDPPKWFVVCLLRGANLRRASLARTHLEGVDFSGANLEGTCFWKACFDGANLSGANLKDARFQETNLSNAKGLTQSQLDSARGDHETLIPEGFIRPKHWGPEQLGYSQTLNPDSE